MSAPGGSRSTSWSMARAAACTTSRGTAPGSTRKPRSANSSTCPRFSTKTNVGQPEPGSEWFSAHAMLVDDASTQQELVQLHTDPEVRAPGAASQPGSRSRVRPGVTLGPRKHARLRADDD